MEHPDKLILFDGVCNFCSFWVRFAYKRDKKRQLYFTSLQGAAAARILPRYQLEPTALTSVIFIDKGKAYTQSSAAFRVCKYLSGGWKSVYALLIIPRFIRDGIYNIFARNRYKWFGKKDACMVPPPGWKDQFLD